MEDIPWEDENRADLITTDEALELLAYYDIPEETMQEWVKSGTLEQVLTSDGAVRYRRKDILALQQHYFPAGGEPVPVPSALIDLRSAVLRTLVVPGAVHIEVTGDDSVHLYLGRVSWSSGKGSSARPGLTFSTESARRSSKRQPSPAIPTA